MSEETPGGDDTQRGALRKTLDTCVFAPVGMAMSFAEELPEMVRHRVGLQLSNAKVVGRFVVTRGQRRLSDRLDEVLHGLHDEVGYGEKRPTATAPQPNPTPTRVPTPTMSSTPTAPADPAAAAVVEGALADYDTLSASQVVRRLESLGPDELHAVQRYEASTRNRRTILNRASQLLEEGPAAAAGE